MLHRLKGASRRFTSLDLPHHASRCLCLGIGGTFSSLLVTPPSLHRRFPPSAAASHLPLAPPPSIRRARDVARKTSLKLGEAQGVLWSAVRGPRAFKGASAMGVGTSKRGRRIVSAIWQMP